MTTHVALLRAVNVGGRTLPMADLRRCLEGLAANPFLSEPGVDQGSLHATFLFTPAGEDDSGAATTASYGAVYGAAFRGLQLPAGEGERAVFVGSPPLAAPVVYLHLPCGYGRSKLTNAYFERKLGTVATTRNWRTVTALAALSAPGAGAPSDEDDGGSA